MIANTGRMRCRPVAARARYRRRCSILPSTPSSLCDPYRLSALLTAAEDTRPYECDGLTASYRELPAAVAIPEDEAQVVAILSRMPRGARAGRRPRRGYEPLRRSASRTSSGVRAVAGEVPADHLAIDPLARTAVVQPGVRNLAISEAAAPLRPLLRARSVVADRVHDRRQRRGERRRRPLSQAWSHRAQRAAACAAC